MIASASTDPWRKICRLSGAALPFAGTAVLALWGAIYVDRARRYRARRTRDLTYATPRTHDGKQVEWDDLQFWTRAFERRSGWRSANDDEAPDFHLGVGTEERGGRIRRYGGATRKEFHNKQRLFGHLSSSQLPFVPLTYTSLEAFKAAGEGGSAGDLWFFKKAEESRGRGVFPFRSLQHIPAEDLAEAGVFQREVADMQLFPTGCKFDLRVLAVFGPGPAARVYETFFVRTTVTPFDAASLARAVQCTNLSQGGKVHPWRDSAGPLPHYAATRDKIFDAVAKVAGAMRAHFPEGRMHYFGFDFMLDRDSNPWLLEINSTPHLINSNAAGDVDRMLDDLLEHVLEPELGARPPSHSPPPSRWTKVFDARCEPK